MIKHSIAQDEDDEQPSKLTPIANSRALKKNNRKRNRTHTRELSFSPLNSTHSF